MKFVRTSGSLPERAEIGDAQYTYDWKKHHVTSIPLSGQPNRIVSIQSQNIHLFFRAQYDLKNESGSDKWTLAAGFSLILSQEEENLHSSLHT